MKNFLFCVSFLFVFMSSYAGVWSGGSSVWTEGKGTEADPFLIATAENLAYLAERVNAGETYDGVFFKLTDNLDMNKSSYSFTPIGVFDGSHASYGTDEINDDSKYFLGTFDGNFKTVDNVYICSAGTGNGADGTGLFACISGNAVIKNLVIGAGTVVDGTGASGTVVGAMTGGKVERCVNMAPLRVTQGLGHGGIVGVMYGGVVSECVNYADIMGNANVGGIAGFVDGGGIVENCYNRGDLVFMGFYAGGIIGNLTEGSLQNCYTTGMIADEFSCGAVVGTTDMCTSIENCYYLEIEDAAADATDGTVGISDGYMKKSAFMAMIDDGQNVWTMDINNINDGYPVLCWQDYVTAHIGNTAAAAGKIKIFLSGHNIYTSAEGPCVVNVTDVAGNTVVRQTLDGNALFIADKGVYIVTASDGKSSGNCKIVIR